MQVGGGGRGGVVSVQAGGVCEECNELLGAGGSGVRCQPV